jgi:hypothetical protein
MLNIEQVALVKGMLDRGDKQHDIAAFFYENGGRIAEIKTGAKHKEVKAAPKKDLPSRTEMSHGFMIYECRKALDRAQLGIDSGRAYLAELAQRLDMK